MAKFEGGIFSRARGKASGLVFSEANTRQGKRQTVRGLVQPHDPGTPRQMLARQAQSNSSGLVRLLNDIFQERIPAIQGSFSNALYQKAVGQLSGFQSLKSVILSARNMQADIVEFSETPPPTVAGNLHTPASISFTPISAAAMRVDWSTELGQNGSPNDTAIVGLFSIDERQDTGRYLVNFDSNGEGRSTGTAQVSSPSGRSMVGGWLLFFAIVSTSGVRVINRGTYVYSQQPQPFM